MSDINTLLRSLPSVEELLSADWALSYACTAGRDYVKKVITLALDGIRDEVCASGSAKTSVNNGSSSDMKALAEQRSLALLHEKSSGTLKPVINATGVVIHTNLGRSPLAGDAMKAVARIAAPYSTLEYSLEKGARGGRNSHVEWLICQITGAEAALVVNNNAAAVLLALSALASGREVIVSNGELVEIGDSFRIPEILSFSGAAMVAVGCTNSTRIADYRNALTEQTAVLLKVHPSNYRIEGFTASTSRAELADLAASRGIPFMEDLGSGLLCPLSLPFANSEHSVGDCIKAGVDVVTFSGDKLLGGPQIGVIAGAKRYINMMKSHQLLRALRVDKMTLAAFEATLRMYVSGRHGDIPVIKMIEMEKADLLKKARRLCRMLRQKVSAASERTSVNGGDLKIEVVETVDAVGGGAFPTDKLSGFGVAISSTRHSAENLARALRNGSTPIIPGIQDGRIILHVRTLLDGDERVIAKVMTEALAQGNGAEEAKADW